MGVGLFSAWLSRRAVRSRPPWQRLISALLLIYIIIGSVQAQAGLGGGGGESGTVGVGAEGWGWCAFRCASNALKTTGNLDECIVVCVGRFVYGAFLMIFLVISPPATEGMGAR